MARCQRTTCNRQLTVGVLGFEPRTSALSELRSSQLSYTPLRRGAEAAPFALNHSRPSHGPAHPQQKSQTDDGLALSDTKLWIERQPPPMVIRIAIRM